MLCNQMINLNLIRGNFRGKLNWICHRTSMSIWANSLLPLEGQWTNWFWRSWIRISRTINLDGLRQDLGGMLLAVLGWSWCYRYRLMLRSRMNDIRLLMDRPSALLRWTIASKVECGIVIVIRLGTLERNVLGSWLGDAIARVCRWTIMTLYFLWSTHGCEYSKLHKMQKSAWSAYCSGGCTSCLLRYVSRFCFRRCWIVECLSTVISAF